MKAEYLVVATMPSSCCNISFLFSSDSENEEPFDRAPTKSRDDDTISSQKIESGNQSRDPEPADAKPAIQVDDEVVHSKIKEELLSWRERIEPQYYVGEKIGSGAFGVVYEGTRKIDSRPIAIKLIEKSLVESWGEIDGMKVPIEFELLRKASGHSGVIEMIDWFESQDDFILIMERPSPVIDLFDYLNKFGPVSEETARTIISQIIRAVLHCHSNGVVHLDIKDDNILLNVNTMEIKLIDFGCGAILQDSPYNKLTGTPLCAPPEWFQANQYNGKEYDVWGIGMLLYMLVENASPFESEIDIVTSDVIFTRRDLSRSIQDLIRKILTKNRRERLCISEILLHDWFYEGSRESSGSKFKNDIAGAT